MNRIILGTRRDGTSHAWLTRDSSILSPQVLLAGMLALLAASAAGQAWSFRDPGLWSSGVSVPPPPPLAPPMANLSWWFRADGGNAKNASGAACADGDGVATWVNGGTAGANLTSTGGGASGYVWQSAGGPNGLPAVAGTLDAATKYLQAPGGSGAAQPITCFFLVRVSSTTGAQVLCCDYNAINTIQFDFAGLMGCGTSQLVVYTPGEPFCKQALPDLTSWKLLTVCFNGASSFARVNGAQTSTFDVGLSPANFSQLYFGNTFGGGPYWVQGAFPEFLIYRGRTFTTDDLTAVETYLQAKYGL